MGALAWLLGSSLGRKAALAGIVAMVIAIGVWRIFAAGQARERAKRQAARLKTIQTRIKTDEEIAGLTRDERAERLRRWVSDDQ